MSFQLAWIIPVAAFFASSETPQKGYSLLDAYGEFVKACEAVKAADDFSLSLEKQGWEKFEPKAEEPMGRLVAYLASERWRLEKDSSAIVNTPNTFKHNISGGKLELMVQEFLVGEGKVVGCRAWDFNPIRKPTINEIVELKSEPPNRKISSTDLLMAEWGESEDGILLGSQIHFIPPDGRSAKALGVSGLSFKMSFIRISKQ